MSEETCCITNKEKATKDEWEDDDSDFPRAILSVVYASLRLKKLTSF